MNLTKEQCLVSLRNKRKTSKFFNLSKGYVLHHKDETLRQSNIERYIQWNIDDVIPMSIAEHNKLHHNKKVLCVETNIIYNSRKEAHELTSVSMSGISKVCNGITKTAGGYHWQFI